jgi:hypothetical protein
MRNLLLTSLFRHIDDHWLSPKSCHGQKTIHHGDTEKI